MLADCGDAGETRRATQTRPPHRLTRPAPRTTPAPARRPSPRPWPHPPTHAPGARGTAGPTHCSAFASRTSGGSAIAGRTCCCSPQLEPMYSPLWPHRRASGLPGHAPGHTGGRGGREPGLRVRRAWPGRVQRWRRCRAHHIHGRGGGGERGRGGGGPGAGAVHAAGRVADRAVPRLDQPRLARGAAPWRGAQALCRRGVAFGLCEIGRQRDAAERACVRGCPPGGRQRGRSVPGGHGGAALAPQRLGAPDGCRWAWVRAARASSGRGSGCSGGVGGLGHGDGPQRTPPASRQIWVRALGGRIFSCERRWAGSRRRAARRG
jgi:hypothetical protein